MVTTALVLMWMTRLIPIGTHCRSGGVVSLPSVAEAIASAANDDDDEFNAAAYLAAIGYYESGYCIDAVSGPEDPTWSYGPWQLSEIWLPPLPISLDWQAHRALALVRESQARCGDLTLYVSGHCHGAPGVAAKRDVLVKRFLEGAFPGVRIERAVPLLPKHAPQQPATSGAEPALSNVQVEVCVRRADDRSSM